MVTTSLLTVFSIAVATSLVSAAPLHRRSDHQDMSFPGLPKEIADCQVEDFGSFLHCLSLYNSLTSKAGGSPSDILSTSKLPPLTDTGAGNTGTPGQDNSPGEMGHVATDKQGQTAGTADSNDPKAQAAGGQGGQVGGMSSQGTEQSKAPESPDHQAGGQVGGMSSQGMEQSKAPQSPDHQEGGQAGNMPMSSQEMEQSGTPQSPGGSSGGQAGDKPKSDDPNGQTGHFPTKRDPQPPQESVQSGPSSPLAVNSDNIVGGMRRPDDPPKEKK